ncbi:hypothetical protein HY230_08600 [Candidatus Acetothermia bacterium]|nr:hypothetical protein [Candidatus Acetothermia bacterium]
MLFTSNLQKSIYFIGLTALVLATAFISWPAEAQDTTPPTVTITSITAPEDGFLASQNFSTFPAIVGAGPITVNGTVSDVAESESSLQDGGAITVEVNGVSATVTEGDWTATNVSLNVGANTIIALAKDSSNNENNTQVQVTLNLDLDGDGIRNNVDLEPETFSSEFSDSHTSGKVLEKSSNVTMDLMDAPNPSQGIKVLVSELALASEPSEEFVKLTIDGSCAVYKLLSPGTFMLTFTPTVTIENESKAEVEYIIGGTTIIVGVDSGGGGGTGKAHFDESCENQNLENFNVQPEEGTVDVNGVNVPVGKMLTVPIPVSLDVKPDSFPNLISQTMGAIPVAIFSTLDFDALNRLNITTLTFGRTGNEQSLIYRPENERGVAFCSRTPRDVDRDGLFDEVCYFDASKTGFQVGDTEGILKGTTVEGIPIKGQDTVQIVPAASLSVGGQSAVSPTLSGLKAIKRANAVQFIAQGMGIEAIKVEIFNLSGKRIYDNGFVGSTSLSWNLRSNQGNQANGVFLYIVTVRGRDGTVIRSDLRKLLIAR